MVIAFSFHFLLADEGFIRGEVLLYYCAAADPCVAAKLCCSCRRRSIPDSARLALRLAALPAGIDEFPNRRRRILRALQAEQVIRVGSEFCPYDRGLESYYPACLGGTISVVLTATFGGSNSPGAGNSSAFKLACRKLTENLNNTAALVHHYSPSSPDSAYNNGHKFCQGRFWREYRRHV
jgi:hypothetical protein